LEGELEWLDLVGFGMERFRRSLGFEMEDFLSGFCGCLEGGSNDIQ
jgi:hypothetical protein